MCTVTFIPTSSGFYLTSNRDERISRATVPPDKYTLKGLELYYPKDELSGGTWIASNPEGRVACLLNGAFANHQKEKYYRKSRGTILLESFQFNTISEFSEKTDLENIEPFTLLQLDFTNSNRKQFHEFRWDGEKKHLTALSQSGCQIWSSAALYSSLIQEKRKNLFDDWVEKHKHFEDRMIFDFHNKKHGLNATEDILMEGCKDLRTVSISQVHLSDAITYFNHMDLIKHREYKINLDDAKLADMQRARQLSL